MTNPIILCTDGSEQAIHALREGLGLLHPDGKLVVVTVVEPVDATLVTGTGIAGGVMSPDAFDDLVAEQASAGQTIVAEAADALFLAGVETQVLRGEPGPALCHYAEEISARAIVMGSRGRGGIRRALLGSVSDHVVRHAPCPVVITGPAD